MNAQATTAQQFVSEMQHDIRPGTVFGAPIQADGATLIPTMSVRGGVRARGGNRDGAGYGVRARPVGVYVLRDGKVAWRPAIDVNRIIWGGQLLGMTAAIANGVAWMLLSRTAQRRRSWGRRLGLLALAYRLTHRRRSFAQRWLQMGR
jgi:uncharacterized spore protein YtfJ